MSARRLLPVCLSLAIAPLVLTSAASAAMKIRIATPTAKVTIPAKQSVGSYFAESQRISTTCRPKERALAPGILDSSRHVVAQSFGPSAVGAYAAGAKGTARLRLQLLCVRGANVFPRRKPGKTIPMSSRSMTTVAKVSCGSKRYAIGAPLSQDFAPGFGRFISKPAGPHGWQVTVENVPSTFPLNATAPAYADVACVPKKSLKALQVIEESTTGLTSSSTAKLRLDCKGGRRPVGWGVDLRPFSMGYSPSDDGWAIPIVRKAAFSGSSFAFQFDLPPGARKSTGTITQTGYVICAKLA